MPSTKVTLSIRQDKKHSVRFDSTDKEAGVQSIYVSRKVPGINEAKAVTLIIEPAIAD